MPKRAVQTDCAPERDWYAVLGLDRSADYSAIRHAYKVQALRTHPDKGGASEQFRDVVEAFEVLSRTFVQSDQMASSKQSEAYSSAMPSKKRRGAAAAGADHNHVGSPPSGTNMERQSKMDAGTQPQTPRPEHSFEEILQLEPLELRRHLEAVGESELARLREFLAQLQAKCKTDHRREPASVQRNHPHEHKSKTRPNISSETESEHEDHFFALLDADGIVEATDEKVGGYFEECHGASSARPRRQNHGIINFKTKTITEGSFCVRVSINNLGILTQRLHGLETALDAHVSLVQVRRYVGEKVRQGIALTEALRESIDTVLLERRDQQQPELVLRFNLDCWKGGTNSPYRKATGPRYTQWTRSLSTALHYHQKIVSLYEYGGDDLEAGLATLRNAIGKSVTTEQQARKQARKQERDTVRHQKEKQASKRKEDLLLFKRKVASAVAILNAVCRERARSKKVRMRRFGIAALPDNIAITCFNGEDFLQARLTAVNIWGPYRESVQEAVQDASYLEAILESSGAGEARVEATRMEADAMTAMFVRSLQHM